jgi:hypothetical protein
MAPLTPKKEKYSKLLAVVLLAYEDLGSIFLLNKEADAVTPQGVSMGQRPWGWSEDPRASQGRVDWPEGT